jgi:hypothetical protein
VGQAFQPVGIDVCGQAGRKAAPQNVPFQKIHRPFGAAIPVKAEIQDFLDPGLRRGDDSDRWSSFKLAALPRYATAIAHS